MHVTRNKWSIKNWLKSSLKLLEENQTVDAVFLRRYINDYESRSTGILGYINTNDSVELELDSLKYFIVPIGSYTNNPLVRRNSSFYNKKEQHTFIKQLEKDKISVKNFKDIKDLLCKHIAYKLMENKKLILLPLFKPLKI